ncbi:MAG: response regulator [Lachnospiraceae bacterium]|nr:response regulator [Lachnospiraceae bacterium]
MEKNKKLEELKNKQAEKIKKRTEKLARKRARINRDRWMFVNIVEKYSWKGLSFEEKRGRIIEGIVIAIASTLSVLLYHFCFGSGEIETYISMLLFSLYLIPVSSVVILYGQTGGKICFSVIFFIALLMEPSNVYLIFLHLAAMYVFTYVVEHRHCEKPSSALICGIVTGLIISGVYYFVFVMIGQESFATTKVDSLLIHIASVAPQCVAICFLTFLLKKGIPDKVKLFFGVRTCGPLQKDELKRVRFLKGRAGVGDKVFTILLMEAIILGIAAAGFANSLIPGLTDVVNKAADAAAYESMIEDGGEGSTGANPGSEAEASAEDESNTGAASGDENDTGASAEGEGNTEAVPDAMKSLFRDEGAVNEIMGNLGFDRTFAVAQVEAQRNRFKYNEQGVAFDLKLFLMLVCAIHPIVFIANAFAQTVITSPIESMTDVMREFTDDPESRIVVGNKLGKLGIQSGDEIEELYASLYNTVGELNTYIDKMKEEQQLREDLRVAKAASEAKSNFLSNVSHEIRTPINAVLGLDEMILRESSEKAIKKYAVDIKNSGKTLLALINDLLDFSKIEAGKMEILPVEYELSSVVNDLINMVSAKAADKGLELKIDVAKDIPHVLYGDEIRVKQCILNILNNAVKYTPKGSVTMRLVSRYVSEDEIALKVNVIDTGIGIKEEDLSKLYSPFERIEESRNRTIEGTGLGMSIVKQLLDMMGSQLVVKSVYGEGSDFSFEIVQKVINKEPIGDFNETYEKSLESMSEYSVSFVAPEGHILVVDDTPMNLTVIKGLLKETLLRVDTATSGAQCLELVKKNNYDIIFMDQRMPEMDGTETLQHIKEMPAEENLSYGKPVICLTANVVSGARENFIKAGFTDYLGKPIDADKLEKMLAKYLPDSKLLSPESEEGRAAILENEKSATGVNEGTKGEAFADKEMASGKEPSEFEVFMRGAEGLDYDAGIANCMKEDILKEAVHDFYVSLKENPDLIENLWKSGDIRNYTIKVHALKSSSRLIGASELSAKAAFLESCGDKEDTEKIDELTPGLLDMYRGYKEILSPLYGEPADTEGGDNDDRELIDEDTLSQGYGALKEAVSAFDYDTADEIVGMLKNYRFPDAEKEKFERVCDLVTSLDRDEILQIL